MILQQTYGEIPDSVPSKEFLPLTEHFFKHVKELGWDYFHNDFDNQAVDFFTRFSDVMRDKFHRSVNVAKLINSEEIKHPDKIFSTFFFPPVLFVRSDLQAGGTKLIYGESTDITFVIINDVNHEIFFLANAHTEAGIPVDWWFVNVGDEVFERRHLKLGIKLKDIAKKSKNIYQAGERIIDSLKDIRNERTPEFVNSSYTIAMTWISSAYNYFLEFSNYNRISALYDNVHAKKLYGFPDHYVCYTPWPPFIKMLLQMSRGDFTNKIAGLLCRNRLFVNALEPRHLEFDKNRIPEVWDIMKRDMREKGIPTPYQSINCKPPDFKNKKIGEGLELNWEYPKGSRVMPYSWGLTDDEAFGGIYTDITQDTPPKAYYEKDHVISMGVGEHTKIMKV